MDKYKDWSKEDLITYIQSLEENNTTTKQPQSSPSSNEKNLNNSKNNKNNKKKKQERPFDITKYRQRRVAFKVAYLGWNYIGFAAQQDEILLPTVEGQLFRALEHCKLISHRDACDYSRCGRTDRGVSGLGQVIILNVRSKQSAISNDNENEPYLSPDEELPYVDNLNRALPDDIRILAWSPVPSRLNARFDCQSRTYRYLFRQEQLNIALMQQAAAYFIGEHDFRNFCKLDPSKNITNYHRRMLSCTITPFYDNAPSSPQRMMKMELKGTAFLWHQVRCMMSVLFLVGQQLEPPTIIQDLLNTELYNARPDYPMASDLPLILYDCEFDPNAVQWITSSTIAIDRVVAHWDQFSYAQDIRASTCHYFYQAATAIQQQQIENNNKMNIDTKEKEVDGGNKRKKIVLGGGVTSLLNQYKPLAERPRCDTDEMKKDKYNAKKRKREQLENEPEIK